MESQDVLLMIIILPISMVEWFLKFNIFAHILHIIIATSG